MTHLAWIGFALVLLAVAGLACWSWRNNLRLQQLDQRVRRQSELLEQIDSALESPQLGEGQPLIGSEAPLAKPRESDKP